jgi:ABC-type phosphate transport system permease subunit/ABC-type phosphate transport system auxiliary subunit
MVWLMAMAVIVCLVLIIGIVGLIVVRGSATFWPGPMVELTLLDGSVLLGVPSRTESYRPGADEEEQIQEAVSSGAIFVEDAFTAQGEPRRRRYFLGNRDLGQESFRWIPLWTVASITRPDDGLLVERLEWGSFLGRARALITIDDDGSMEETPVLSGKQGLDQLHDAIESASVRRQAIDRINLHEIPRLANKTRSLKYELKGAALDRARAENPRWPAPPRWVWWLALFTLASSLGGVWALRRKSNSNSRSPLQAAGILLCVVVALGSVSFVVLERPGARAGVSDAALALVQDRVNADESRVQDAQELLLSKLASLRAEDARYRVVLVEPGQGRISPKSRSTPDDPMLVSQIVRVVPANRLGFGGRVGVYLSRWWEFLSTNPREGASAGGVFPVIVGTVTLTMLLTISVVPLGVIAALYLREYARQGVVTSIIRIAINNLAGVPSIVYGMFGLGFFCYTLGGYIDAGPKEPAPFSAWWGMIGAVLLTILLAGTLGIAARQYGKTQQDRRARILALAGGVFWLLAVGLALWVFSTTPYFGGFFAAKLPEQTTFGGRGILWASLTLALLTLPVVIVATEEAISAVPGSTREGSYGCGASKWQTIRSIVLPSAMPGILTGAILAMARGAGEVAPLMLVGAVNLAPALPVSTEFPFLHGDRTFMHLGFHIYTLGFQSPDSEATAPLVWTTTLLLISIVLVLNLVAIVVRARLRARMKTSAV